MAGTSVMLWTILIHVLSFDTGNQQGIKSVYTSDVDNFWLAYDQIRSTSDTTAHLNIVQSVYIDNATTGLRAFMRLRRFNAETILASIKNYPKFWTSIRSEMSSINRKAPLLEKYLLDVKKLYPYYREANIFFTISGLRAGGTTYDSMVLIGSEIALGNKKTDVSEFSDKRLPEFFESQPSDNLIPFVVHEFIHTQQKGEGETLLGRSISEGVCDFIAELVLHEPLHHAYLRYGKENEAMLKDQFKNEMWGNDISNWLYNGSTTSTVGDLGYFMGYAICKSFYYHASDKSLAIKEMIELDYKDEKKLKNFLHYSNYYDNSK